MYIRDANILIVTYDITSKINIIRLLNLGKESFNNLNHWIEEVRDLKNSNLIFALVGNKLDLEDTKR